MKTTVLCLATCAALGLSGACHADDMVAAKQFSGTNLGFLLKGALRNSTLSVAGPDDFHASTFSKSGAVAIDLGKFGALEDGLYHYQITAATDQPANVRTPLNDGRDDNAKVKLLKSVEMSGTFDVTGGKIVEPVANAKDSGRDTPTGGTAK